MAIEILRKLLIIIVNYSEGRSRMNYIRKARKAQGYTQQRLAELVGITQGAVSQWEKGETRPAVKMLPALSKALGVPIDELVRGLM